MYRFPSKDVKNSAIKSTMYKTITLYKLNTSEDSKFFKKP